jgi:hypothetical protein
VDAAPSVHRLALRSHGHGCLAYALIGVALAAVLALVLGLALSVLAAALGASDDVATVLILAGFGSGLVLGPLVAWRSYRRRAGGELRVWPDRVEFLAAEGAAPVVLPHGEIDEIVVALPERPRAAGRIELRGVGRSIRLSEAWTLGEVALDLSRALVPAMVERAAARLEQGETLEFRPPRGALLRPVLGVLACGGLLVFAAVQVATRWGTKDAVEPKALLFVFLLVSGLVAGLQLLRRRWGAGVLASRSGVRRPGRDAGAETPWSAIVRSGTRDGVLELATDGPAGTFRCPLDAPNALLLPALAERCRPGA